MILAGGVGKRVGRDVPKQFIEIFGKPIIIYTLEAFQYHEEIDAIEIVCVKNYKSYLKKLVKKYNISKVNSIVDGGEDFQHSVLNGVRELSGKLSDDDIIIIHGAGSPLIGKDVISDGIRVCKNKGNSMSASPATMLYGMKSKTGDSSVGEIDRDSFMILGPPQCFKYKFLHSIYEDGEQRGLLGKIDPHTPALMYALQQEIFFSKGNGNHFKITTEEDIEMFKALISNQHFS